MMNDSEKIRKLINLVNFELNPAVLNEAVPIKNNTASQSIPDPEIVKTDPTQMQVKGAKGNINPIAIAKFLNLTNPVLFGQALVKLKGSDSNLEIRQILNQQQAWVLADAFWQLITADNTIKRRIIGMVASFVKNP